MRYFFVLLILFCGCAPVLLGVGAGIGVAGYKYISGELTVRYIGDYEQIWNATVNALHSLNIKIEEIKKDEISGYVRAKKADGKMVVVKVKNKSSRIVEVKIKVGIFGDEDASFTIKTAIDRKLGIR